VTDCRVYRGNGTFDEYRARPWHISFFKPIDRYRRHAHRAENCNHVAGAKHVDTARLISRSALTGENRFPGNRNMLAGDDKHAVCNVHTLYFAKYF
jgi:hypothetical protein